jgi:tungstate transport system substrate-binding protein
MKVDVIAVGTGRALELGRRGDVDLVMVHAPAREEAFVRNGYGVNRRQLMHNYFLLIGPPTDPAQARAAPDVKDALNRIERRQAVFVSRGDDSGTHIKERSLWKAAGVQPSGSWYKEAGAGMGTVLTMSSEMGGYTLSDSGTFLSMKEKLQLAEIIEQDPSLLNPYGIIAVNPARYPHVRYIESMMLIGYLTSPEGQKSIIDFQPTGKTLFWPDAIPQD